MVALDTIPTLAVTGAPTTDPIMVAYTAGVTTAAADTAVAMVMAAVAGMALVMMEVVEGVGVEVVATVS